MFHTYLKIITWKKGKGARRNLARGAPQNRAPSGKPKGVTQYAYIRTQDQRYNRPAGRAIQICSTRTSPTFFAEHLKQRPSRSS